MVNLVRLSTQLPFAFQGVYSRILLSQLSHFGKNYNNNVHVNFMQHLLGVIKVLEADRKSCESLRSLSTVPSD